MIQFISDKECITTLDTGELVNLFIYRKLSTHLLVIKQGDCYQRVCGVVYPYTIHNALFYLYHHLSTTCAQSKLLNASKYLVYTYYPETLL